MGVSRRVCTALCQRPDTSILSGKTNVSVLAGRHRAEVPATIVRLPLTLIMIRNVHSDFLMVALCFGIDTSNNMGLSFPFYAITALSFAEISVDSPHSQTLVFPFFFLSADASASVLSLRAQFYVLLISL